MSAGCFEIPEKTKTTTKSKGRFIFVFFFDFDTLCGGELVLIECAEGQFGEHRHSQTCISHVLVVWGMGGE
jgi:hypothetical protein